LPSLSWRATPQTTHNSRPDGHVYQLIRTVDPVQARQGIRVGIAMVVPCDGTNTRAMHTVPNNVDGFTVIPNDSFLTSEAPSSPLTVEPHSGLVKLNKWRKPCWD
jgi:hypothetical protein